MDDIKKKELHFIYSEKIFNECLIRARDVSKDATEQKYLNKNLNDVTLDNFNITFILFYYLLRLPLFDTSKYKANDLNEVKELYFSMVQYYHTFMMKKYFEEEYSEEKVNEYFDVFDSFCKCCDAVFMTSDKTLLSYLATPLLNFHYLMKNGLCIVSPKLDIIPKDHEEYNKIRRIITTMIIETKLYDSVENIVNEYLQKYNELAKTSESYDVAKHDIFKTNSGFNYAMNKDLYEKVITNDKEGITHSIVETYLVAEQYFPQIIQFIILLIFMLNGYTSFLSILFINLVVGVGCTLLWNNTKLYKVPGLAKVSGLIGNYIFRLFLHFIIIGTLSFTFLNDWKILLYTMITGLITHIVKAWFSGYSYTLEHNNDIAKYVIYMVQKHYKK